MLTSDQIRAARALIRWSAQNLANESGISWKTIQRMEDAGVIFINADEEGPGVRLNADRPGQ